MADKMQHVNIFVTNWYQIVLQTRLLCCVSSMRKFFNNVRTMNSNMTGTSAHFEFSMWFKYW